MGNFFELCFYAAVGAGYVLLDGMIAGLTGSDALGVLFLIGGLVAVLFMRGANIASNGRRL